MNRCRFHVRLTVQGPVLSRGVATGPVGIDALPLRDPATERPALPGNLVRGLLRHAWLEFAEQDPAWHQHIARWLGPEPRAARDPHKPVADYQPDRRARLAFDALWPADRSGRPDRFRHRIRVEPDTGAVSGGGLMIVESPFGPGETISFSGHIEVRPPAAEAAAARPDAPDCTGAAELATLRRQLEQGLAWIGAVGGLKGVGFGRLLRAEVDPATAPAPRPLRVPATARAATAQPADLVIGLRLRPQAPFCFPEPGPKGTLGNRYRSADSIPGAALKGALARIWPVAGAWGRLREAYFDGLRITAAVPVQRGGVEARPLAVPYSLAMVERENGIDPLDLALDPERMHRYPRVPLLQPDWKDKHRQLAHRHCGHGEPPEHRLVVQNAIDRDTGTVDYDQDLAAGLLYSLETIAHDKHLWLANLCVPGVDPADRADLVSALETLLGQGLAPLGKTGIAADIDRIDQPWRRHGTGTGLLRHGRAVLTLQSAALLLAPAFVAGGRHGRADLFAAYADYFAAAANAAAAGACDGALRLERFFARQQLAGGRYWWNRFRHREVPYQPLLLTCAGSVFVLEAAPGRDADAERILAGWRDHGLPPHPDAPGGTGPEHWRSNPWLRENGFGDVAVNAELHWCDPPAPQD
jgi:hypothetical protein